MNPGMTFDTALAFYGTLRPGEHNHWLVSDIVGEWVEGVVLGYVFEVTWGEYEGYPGFVPDPAGHRVPVSVLMHPNLAGQFAKIDDFEGPGYARRPVAVFAPDDNNIIGEAGIYETLTHRDDM